MNKLVMLLVFPMLLPLHLGEWGAVGTLAAAVQDEPTRNQGADTSLVIRRVWKGEYMGFDL